MDRFLLTPHAYATTDPGTRHEEACDSSDGSDEPGICCRRCAYPSREDDGRHHGRGRVDDIRHRIGLDFGLRRQVSLHCSRWERLVGNRGRRSPIRRDRLDEVHVRRRVVRTFNIGVGLTAVCSPDAVDGAGRHLSENRCSSYLVGHIEKGSKEARLVGTVP